MVPNSMHIKKKSPEKLVSIRIKNALMIGFIYIKKITINRRCTYHTVPWCYIQVKICFQRKTEKRSIKINEKLP